MWIPFATSVSRLLVGLCIERLLNRIALLVLRSDLAQHSSAILSCPARGSITICICRTPRATLDLIPLLELCTVLPFTTVYCTFINMRVTFIERIQSPLPSISSLCIVLYSMHFMSIKVSVPGSLPRTILSPLQIVPPPTHACFPPLSQLFLTIIRSAPHYLHYHRRQSLHPLTRQIRCPSLSRMSMLLGAASQQVMESLPLSDYEIRFSFLVRHKPQVDCTDHV